MLTAEEVWRSRINAIFGLPEEDRPRAFLELALAFLNAHGGKSADTIRGRPLWYVLDGNRNPIPATVEEAEVFLLDIKKRVVGFDKIGEVKISTVFICLDHMQPGEDRPLVFETMIFGGKYDGYCARCSTWSEAETAHAAAVLLIKG